MPEGQGTSSLGGDSDASCGGSSDDGAGDEDARTATVHGPPGLNNMMSSTLSDDKPAGVSYWGLRVQQVRESAGCFCM